jgi:hypothetical protein
MQVIAGEVWKCTKLAWAADDNWARHSRRHSCRRRSPTAPLVAADNGRGGGGGGAGGQGGLRRTGPANDTAVAANGTQLYPWPQLTMGPGTVADVAAYGHPDGVLLCHSQ